MAERSPIWHRGLKVKRHERREGGIIIKMGIVMLLGLAAVAQAVAMICGRRPRSTEVRRRIDQAAAKTGETMGRNGSAAHATGAAMSK
jgi:hypothetical protein